MKFFADLHIHSKFSRATSQRMELESLWHWANLKGINLLGTGDFTHPAWFSEIKEKTIEKDGFLILKDKKNPPFFVLSGEISCIYSQDGRQRRIHLVVLPPSLEVAEKINKKLGEKGNLYSDGRPILGLSVPQILEILFSISEEIIIIPAHIWTPWYSLYGANSGFDTFEECFQDFSDRIFAIETGLSSDPPMNWRITELDSKSIVSFSDSHSPEKIGREATVLEAEPDFLSLRRAFLRENKKILYTIEFYPEEGKYHYTGHRNCNVVYSPKEVKEKGNICPVCKKPLTLGVIDRVEQLASRPEGFKDETRPQFKYLVPLREIISESRSNKNQKEIEKIFFIFVNYFQGELNVLLEVPFEELKKIDQKVAEGIIKVRKGNLEIFPGFDGVYGKVKIWGDNKDNEKSLEIQPRLF